MKAVFPRKSNATMDLLFMRNNRINREVYIINVND
jgi:hypothetical protein